MNELQDLKSMLKAMAIAGTSTQAFADFVVGHGELWTARLCAATIRCKGFDAQYALNPTPSTLNFKF